MTLLERVALVLWLASGLCGCSTTRNAEKHATDEIQSLSDKEGRKTVDQRVVTGPRDETVYKFALPSVDDVAPPVVGTGAADAGDRVEVAKHRPSVAAVADGAVKEGDERVQHGDGLPPHGPLVEVDVIHTGPAVAETHTEASTAAQVKRDEHKASEASTSSTSKPSAGCMLGLGFWGAILLAALMAGAILYLRLRAKL